MHAASFLRPSRVDGVCLTQDARGVLALAGKHLRHWPLDRDVCAKVRESLEQDEGLDAYVDDAQKATRTARVKSVDVSENALSELPEASCLLALGDSLRELKCARNRLRQPPCPGPHPPRGESFA